MRYSQKLIDKIWDLTVEGMSVGEVASENKLKYEQVRYVLKSKRPSQVFDYHYKEPENKFVDDLYYIDDDGKPQIETPEANIVKSIVKFFKDFYK